MRVLTHLSLENFRLFKEKTSFDLAPITILTGTNSSGKSSLIKAILLLKSNFEKNNSIEEIDFSIGEHNLNDFKNSLNYDSESDIMYFTFSSYINDLGVRLIELGYKLNSKNNSKGKLCSFSIFSSEGEIILSSFKDFDDQVGGNITYKIDLDYLIKNLDDEVLSKNIKKEVFDNPYEKWVQKYWLSNRDDLFGFKPDTIESKFYFDALDELKFNGLKISTGNTQDEIRYFNQSIVYGLRDLGQEVIKWLEMNLNHQKLEFSRTDYGDFFFEDFSKYVLNETIKSIFYNFESISHFSSLRSDSKKYYTESDRNLLSLFIEYNNEFPKFNPQLKEFVFSQLQAFSFGDSIEVVNYKDFIAEVYITRNGRKVLLSDLGYGYTQLLPIIMKIALAAHLGEHDERFFLPPLSGEVYEISYWDSFFLLEEPESNLHPSFQTKIADLIVEANKKFNIRFVIETHSEYLIRKLQYLTAIEKLRVDDTSILYFHQKASSDYLQSPYRSIRIRENGRLSMPFGEGFFDEADKIAYELYRLKLNNN